MSSRDRYYTCSTKARQGDTGCKGRTVPMDKLDSLVADHLERRLLHPERLEEVLSSVLHRREERTERRTTHIAELRKRAAEADAKLKRLYDAIENGVADLSDPMLKDRVAELKAVRDQARADAAPRVRPNGSGRPSRRRRSKRLPDRPASASERNPTTTVVTISARLPNASRTTRARFESWDRRANCSAHWSPHHA